MSSSLDGGRDCNRLFGRECRGWRHFGLKRHWMYLRYVRSGRQREAKFVVSGFQIVLREPFPDLSGSATNNWILVSVIVRFAVENIYPKRSLFEAI